MLLRASAMGGIGRFQLEAAVQSAHAARRLTGRTDWAAILDLYDALLAETGSPVVAINRSVSLADGSALAEYEPYRAARASLLDQAGDDKGADEPYQLAVGLETDPAVRRFLQQRRPLVLRRSASRGRRDEFA